MVRASRLLAVARYEMRSHITGRQALRLLGVAAALLLPAGLIPTPHFPSGKAPPPAVAAPAGDHTPSAGPPSPARIAVRGQIPAALQSRFVFTERAPVEIRGDNPVIVSGNQISNEMRAALETLAGPVQFEFRDFVVPVQLPGRSLLIAILAISLLTGPLADALPGERARRTLEVLLTAGITRGELIGGKWFTWTVSATATAGVAAALACWRGVQAPGWWLAGLPLFIASTVAFGLWLVRLVDDVVGGSAAPMRVLPVAAGSMAALAWGISGWSPLAAAAVPIGGPLLVAADLFRSGPQVLAATAGTVVFVLAVLTRTGADLDRMDTTTSPTRWGAFGLAAVAILLWWLTVAGPGVWGGGTAGAATDLITPIVASMRVGGIALLACALITLARSPQMREAAPAPGSSPALALLTTFVVAAALGVSGPLPDLGVLSARPVLDAMFDRLRIAAVPAAMLLSLGAAVAAVVSIVGQAVLFRGVVAARLGWITSSLLWCVAVCPSAPWAALPASFALGALAEVHGWQAALIAQIFWALAVSAGRSAGGDMPALGIQFIALAIALGALRYSRGEPTRHQL